MQPEVSYRRGLEHNYLVIRNESLGDFQTQMLLHNNINNLLKLQIKNSNSEYEYCYEISSLQPIKRIYEHRDIDYLHLVQILRGLSDAIKNSKEYLLDANGLLISPEYIYADVENMSIKLIHYPLYEGDVKQAYKALSEFFLDKIDHHDNKAVMLAYDLFKIIKTDSFVLSEIDKLIESTDRIKETSIKEVSMKETFTNESFIKDSYTNEDSRQESFAIDTQICKEDTHEKSKKRFFGLFRDGKKKTRTDSEYQLQESMASSGSFIQEVEKIEEIEVKNPENETYGKTVLLSREDLLVSEKRPRLVSRDGKKEYPLERFPVTIGKTKDVVDIVLKDGSVSRMHASIYKDENGKISIKDLASSNGTYVNGVSVDELPMPLENEDEIMIGRVKLDYYE